MIADEIILQKATIKDFDQVYPMLLEINGSRLNQEAWKQLFINHWSDEKYCGFKLVDGTKTVGFMGLIFSKRTINGKNVKIANRTSTVIDRQYRGRGLAHRLIGSVNYLSDYTITTTSGNAVVIKVLKSLGHIEFETKNRFILPFPAIHYIVNPKNYCFKNDIEKESLSNSDKKIYEDHLKFKCEYLYIKEKNQYCFAVFTLIRKKKIKLARIHYISNKNLFFKRIYEINTLLILCCKVLGVVVPERFCRGRKIIFSLVFPLTNPRVFKSSTLQPTEIDSLYSELIVLDF